MSYKVTAALVIIPNADEVSGDGYFYKDAIVPDGWNAERCKVLAKEGMLEKHVEPEPDDNEPKVGTAAYVLKEVGTDKALAQVALDEEKAGQNRKGLVADLEKILAA
jgi:hypothetical protein